MGYREDNALKNKKIAPVIAVGVLIVLVVLITLATKFIQRYIPSKEHQNMDEYYHLTAEDDMAIVLNDSVQDTTCKYLDGRVYIDYKTVHDLLNERFYWDANENILLYTLPDNLITVPAGGSAYQVGKENKTTDYTIVRNDSDVMYMALDFVKEYTNLTYTVFEDPNRVVITTVWGEVETVSVKKDSEIRLKGGIKSPIVKEAAKEEKLTVLDADKTWTKVATTDGIVGYIKSKAISAAKKTVRSNDFTKPEFTHITRDFTIQLAWHQVTNQEANASLANMIQNSKGINVISPTWFWLKDNSGNIGSLASSDYVNYCHQNGIEVWALASNLVDTNVEMTTYVMTHTSARWNLVNQLISAAIQYDLDGINLDFESIDPAAGDGYVQFVRELSLKCANNNIVLSVDNYVPTDYTSFYNRAEQAKFADYVIIMGYDEHYAGSKEGSVASLGFVKEGVANTLLEVPAEQIILGCPFYTRIWALTPKEETDTVEAASEDYVPYEVSSEAIGMDNVMRRLEINGAVPGWSEEDGQNYAEYENEGITYKVWLEDAKSLALKLEVMKSNNLAGAAFWKLGFETDSIWDTIIKYTN